MSRTDAPESSRTRDLLPRREQNARAERGPARKRPFSPQAAVALLLLLVIPVAVIYRLSASIDFRYLVGYWAVISAITYLLYIRDKRKAQRAEWRTPELDLHIGELLGGWAAAFVAQRVIRHKIAKTKYQWNYWAIVLLHQYVGLDFLLNWNLTRGVMRWIEELAR